MKKTLAEQEKKVKHYKATVFQGKISFNDDVIPCLPHKETADFSKVLGEFCYYNQKTDNPRILTTLETLKKGLFVKYIHDDELLNHEEVFTFQIKLVPNIPVESDLIFDTSDF